MVSTGALSLEGLSGRVRSGSKKLGAFRQPVSGSVRGSLLLRAHVSCCHPITAFTADTATESKESRDARCDKRRSDCSLPRHKQAGRLLDKDFESYSLAS